MRILFVGGPTDEMTGPLLTQFRAMCATIGEKAADRGHSLLVCSSHEAGADRWVLEGFVNAGAPSRRLEIPSISRPEMFLDDWADLFAEMGVDAAHIYEIEGGHENENSPEARRNVDLLAQFSALSTCDLVIALGGQASTSAAVLLHVAESRGTPVLPLGFAGGVATAALWRLQPNLRSALGDDADLLWSQQGVGRAIELAEDLGRYYPASERPSRQPYIFISHPEARAAEADLVEKFLRQHRNIAIYRDERNLGWTGKFDPQVRCALDECTHFIGVWCRDYAFSPSTYDEFHQVIKRGETTRYGPKITMLRFDDTPLIWHKMHGLHARWPKVQARAEVYEALKNFVFGETKAKPEKKRLSEYRYSELVNA